MAPKDTAKKTPSAAAAKHAKAKLPVKKKPATQKPTQSETPRPKAKLHIPQIVTQNNLKLILRQIDPDRVFSSGSGTLVLGMINHVADELIKMTFEARPIKRPTCTRDDVGVALRSFLPLVQDGQDGFRHHMKEAIDKYFRNLALIKARDAAARAAYNEAAAPAVEAQ